LKEPQYVSPPILRAEIISDEKPLNDLNGCIRKVQRILIPRQSKRDTTLIQNVCYYQNGQGNNTVHNKKE